MNKLTAFFGLTTVALFVTAFIAISFANPTFHLFNDHISKLGAKGEPFAMYWNIFGFGLVGASFAAFGWCLGLATKDRILGLCLLVAGIGFSTAAIPIDFKDSDSTLSKAHYASICTSLAGWCLGLARLIHDRALDDVSRTIANYTVVLTFLPMLAIGPGVSAEPIAYRFVLLITFAWIVWTSLDQMRKPELAAGSSSNAH